LHDDSNSHQLSRACVPPRNSSCSDEFHPPQSPADASFPCGARRPEYAIFGSGGPLLLSDRSFIPVTFDPSFFSAYQRSGENSVYESLPA